MKTKMTTKKALIITAEHYRWLEKNPKALPNEWPGWEKYGIDVSIGSDDRNPLCVVADGDCMKCPLIALWIKDSGALPLNKRTMSCLDDNSPHVIRFNKRHSDKKEDKELVLKAIRSIYLEAEYALENGVREPDMSVFRIKREKRSEISRVRRS